MLSDYAGLIGMHKIPNFRTIQYRISQMKKEGIKFMIYRSDSIDVIADSKTF